MQLLICSLGPLKSNCTSVDDYVSVCVCQGDNFKHTKTHSDEQTFWGKAEWFNEQLIQF